MPRKTDAREKAIRTASRLFQSQGFHATGLAQIIAESGCPKGSFYHHFPQGKEQLALEAIALAGQRLDTIFAGAEKRRGSRDSAPGTYIEELIGGFSKWAEESDYTEGCPIVSLTLESSASDSLLRDACRAAYADWSARVAQGLERRGMAKARARKSASAAVSAINGAMVVARAERSTRPFQDLTAVLRNAFKRSPRTN